MGESGRVIFEFSRRFSSFSLWLGLAARRAKEAATERGDERSDSQSRTCSNAARFYQNFVALLLVPPVTPSSPSAPASAYSSSSSFPSCSSCRCCCSSCSRPSKESWVLCVCVRVCVSRGEHAPSPSRSLPPPSSPFLVPLVLGLRLLLLSAEASLLPRLASVGIGGGRGAGPRGSGRIRPSVGVHVRVPVPGRPPLAPRTSPLPPSTGRPAVATPRGTPAPSTAALTAVVLAGRSGGTDTPNLHRVVQHHSGARRPPVLPASSVRPPPLVRTTATTVLSPWSPTAKRRGESDAFGLG